MSYHYARFTANGEEQLGTDSYLQLDARVKNPAKIRAALEAHARRHHIIHPDWNGANLYTEKLSCLDQKPARHVQL